MSSSIKKKKCGGCGKLLPPETDGPYCPDTYDICKELRRLRNQKYYQDNKDKVKAITKAYDQSHPEKRSEYNQSRYYKDVEASRQRERDRKDYKTDWARTKRKAKVTEIFES